MSLPAAFTERMQQQLGAEFPAFLEALASAPPVSARRNPLKNFHWSENLEKVKWFSDGVYFPERPVFTLDPFFHGGAYYVQEASSMLIGEAVQQLFGESPPARVLDMAAAPGGKSTLLAAVLPPDSLILANEVIRSRYQVLRENLARWGYPNTHSSNHDPADFRPLEGFFDLILVDAPCSGEGLFRKQPAAASEWSPAAVQLCAGRQKRILADTIPLLAPGGMLLYSTCTFNDQENQENVEWMVKQFGLQPISLDLPADWGIATMRNGYQCYPHHLRGEGFYLACLRAPGDTSSAAIESKRRQSRNRKLPPLLPRRQTTTLASWLASGGTHLTFLQDRQGNIQALPARQLDDLEQLAQVLGRLEAGFKAGTFKQKDFIPSPELALSTVIDPELPGIELDLEQALRYLKKEQLELEDVPQGWLLARYKKINLGWMKGLKNRINNYYPKAWRIRMAIDQGKG